MTNHAKNRASKRGINFEQIKLCVQFGEEIYRTGRLFFFMSNKCLKKLKKIYGSYLSRLEGLVVLTHKERKSINIIIKKNK